MIIIDKNRCTGCGNCVSECVHKAITINNGKAEINRQLCTECGNCIPVCPNFAIHKLAPVLTGQRGGGVKIVYGFGWGRSSRRGAGFGFRGYSPFWPYFGRGRGGLPRCWYPGLPGTVILYGAPTPYWTAPTQEEELVLLKNQTYTTKRQLEDIKRRIRELEKRSK
jgi:NAD-dependent dihydropyrimidine dehydrogenase PreA subunit